MLVECRHREKYRCDGTVARCRAKLASVVALVFFGLTSIFAQVKSTAAAPGSSVESVLTQMDSASAKFRTAEADFVWDQFQKVVNETDTQKGKVYYRRTGKGETQMAANIQSPEQRYLIFSDGKVRLYQPRIEQVNEYDAGKNDDCTEQIEKTEPMVEKNVAQALRDGDGNKVP